MGDAGTGQVFPVIDPRGGREVGRSTVVPDDLFAGDLFGRRAWVALTGSMSFLPHRRGEG